MNIVGYPIGYRASRHTLSVVSSMHLFAVARLLALWLVTALGDQPEVDDNRMQWTAATRVRRPCDPQGPPFFISRCGAS